MTVRATTVLDEYVVVEQKRWVHSLDVALIALGQSATPPERLEAVFAAYSHATGLGLSSPPSDAEREAVASWLTGELMHGDLTLMARFPTLQATAYPRISDKAFSVTQLPCPSCCVSGDGGRIDFAVRVRPFSMQSRIGREIGGELKAAIRLGLQSRPGTSLRWSGPVCLSLLVLYGTADRDMDADNSVKGFLDALSGSVYMDDAQIQHLSVRKLRHEGVDRCYRATARHVYPADADVIRRNTAISWQLPEIVVRAPDSQTGTSPPIPRT